MFLVDSLVAAAASYLAKLPKREEIAASMGQDAATSQRDAETHRLTGIERAIHAGIDFRGVVPLLFIGGIFFGAVKDAQALIPAPCFIVATWACILGAGMASVSIWASLQVLAHPRQREMDQDRLLEMLFKTTIRKIVSFDIALVVGMIALVAYGVGMTISVAGR